MTEEAIPILVLKPHGLTGSPGPNTEYPQTLKVELTNDDIEIVYELDKIFESFVGKNEAHSSFTSNTKLRPEGKGKIRSYSAGQNYSDRLYYCSKAGEDFDLRECSLEVNKHSENKELLEAYFLVQKLREIIRIEHELESLHAGILWVYFQPYSNEKKEVVRKIDVTVTRNNYKLTNNSEVQ